MYPRHQAALVAQWQPSLKPSQLHFLMRRQRRQCPQPALLVTRNFHTSILFPWITHTSANYAYNTLTFIHDYSGLPWGLSITITAILLRSLLTLPMYYLIFSNKRKMDVTEPLRIAYRNAWIKKKKEAAKQAEQTPPSQFDAMDVATNSKVAMLLFKKSRHSPYVALLPVLYLPVWLNCNYVLASMTTRGSPSPEGLLWFPDLTAFDPFLSILFVGLLVQAGASEWLQGLRLVDTFSKTRGGPYLKSWVYRYPTLFPALCSIGFYLLHPPAAVALFCVSSSACALVQRAFMRRWMGRGQNTIMPARPREMRMRVAVATDANGIPSYGQSWRVPKEFDDLFARTQIRPSPGRAPFTSHPAQSNVHKPSGRV